MFRIKQIFLALTKSEKVTFFLASGGLILSGIILVALGFIALTRPVPATGGEYTEGFIGQPAYINPVLASSETDKNLVRLVFSNIQDVAEKIEPSADGRTWKIRLKEKIKWHDGEKLTSDDVIFTIQKIQDQESSSPLAKSWQGVAAQRLSELELQLSLINPYAFFGEILKTLYIAPKHIFENIPPANWRLSEYNLRPVGSGPYKFISFEKKLSGFITTYRLGAWDGYFEEKPFIDNFYLNFFTSNEDLINNFNSGQIDAVGGIDPQDLALIKRPYEKIGFRLPSYYAVFLNQNKSIPLQELTVRKAISLAIDKSELVKIALGDSGTIQNGPLPENGTSTATSSSESAPSILDTAGWKTGNDGIREKTIGKSTIRLEFDLTVPKINFLVKTAEYLKGEWEKIGIKANLQILDSEEDLSLKIKNRDYEMLLFGNSLSRGPDLFSFWHSSERFYPGLNIALYNNKKADSLIESIRQNLDEEKRRGQLGALEDLIAADYPAAFLYSPSYIYISSKNVRGIETTSISEPAERFKEAKKWYLKTARVLK